MREPIPSIKPRQNLDDVLCKVYIRKILEYVECRCLPNLKNKWHDGQTGWSKLQGMFQDASFICYTDRNLPIIPAPNELIVKCCELLKNQQDHYKELFSAEVTANRKRFQNPLSAKLEFVQRNQYLIPEVSWEQGPNSQAKMTLTLNESVEKLLTKLSEELFMLQVAYECDPVSYGDSHKEVIQERPFKHHFEEFHDLGPELERLMYLMFTLLAQMPDQASESMSNFFDVCMLYSESITDKSSRI